MFEHQGVWLPDGEAHFVKCMDTTPVIVDGKGTYQLRKLRAALVHVRQFRTAVDIGAHCGLWSMQLVKRFAHIEAFEPVALNRECFKRNVVGDATLHACALGDHEDSIKITTNPTCSADSRVDGAGDIPMHTLDSFALKEVDFIKLDTEGYELFAVRGAEETIKRNKPTIIIEQKGHGMEFHGFKKEEAAELLESWGMRRVINLSGDIVLVPKL